MTDTVRSNGYKAPPRDVVDPGSVLAEQAAAAERDGWVKPTPAGSPTLPPLPVERLPNVLSDIACAAAAEVQVPTDMGGVLSLSTTAAAVAGKVEIEARAGHVEQLPIWTFTAALSAERKTALFNILRKPFTDYEQEHQRERLMEIRRAEMQKKRLEVALNAKVKKSKETLSSADLADEESIHEQLEDLKVPPKLQLWVSSPTPEAVHNLLSEHDGRMAVFSDEGGLFGIIAGRYAGKSGGADIDPFLQGYNGSPLRAPRVTAERKNVAAAYLTMGFTVQPKILSELGTVDGIEDKGMIGRFLYSLPESTVGGRRYRDAIPIAEDISKAYADTMRRLIEMPIPAKPHRLLLAPDAWEAYADFADRIEERLDKRVGDLARIGSWGGKIAGTTLRIAALFHLVSYEDALGRSVNRAHVENAAALAEEYLIPHALAAFRVVRHGAEKSVTQRLVSWIADNQLKQFTQREAFQQLKGGKAGRVQSVDDVLPALTHLEDGGWIRQAKARRKDTVAFEVNPLWDYR